jgi:hypothetical protein
MHSLQFAPTSRDFGGVRDDRSSKPAAERTAKNPIAGGNKYLKIRPKQGSRSNHTAKNFNDLTAEDHCVETPTSIPEGYWRTRFRGFSINFDRGYTECPAKPDDHSGLRADLILGML